jgi:hypothetical protein
MSVYGLAALTNSGTEGAGLDLRLRSKRDIELNDEGLFDDDPKFRDEDPEGMSEFVSPLNRVSSGMSTSGRPPPTP